MEGPDVEEWSESEASDAALLNASFLKEACVDVNVSEDEEPILDVNLLDEEELNFDVNLSEDEEPNVDANLAQDDEPNTNDEPNKRSCFATHSPIETTQPLGSQQNPLSYVEDLEAKLSINIEYEDSEHVYDLYCEYGKAKGFSVRRGRQKYVGITPTVRWKEFLCSCEGKSSGRQNSDRILSYKKLVLRSRCLAKVRVSRVQPTVWRITKFVTAHSHQLVPADQSYMLRSARNISIGKQVLLESMVSRGVGVNVACGYMEQQFGGRDKLGFTIQDAYDHLKRKRRVTTLKNGDAGCVMKYFMDKHNEERDFFWTCQLDDDGNIMNFFFRDSRSSEDYKVFGDVLSVDTTYRTNRYNLICAPFVGVNHHTFNVLFGMAFMSDETTETFEWLFNAFLKSMGGKEPKIIFSDQSVPMMNAIDKVFPQSKHRLCQWHISKNAVSHFGKLNSNPEFKKMWHSCMNGVESEEEFESVWKIMMQRYNLYGKTWFKGMYRLRQRWASVFTRHYFSAGLHATSRSEATNRVVKYLQRSSNSLYEFVCNLEEIQYRWRNKEIEDDTLGIWVPGQVLADNDLLSHAASIYTRYVYRAFESQFILSNNVVLVGDILRVGDDEIKLFATTSKNARRRTITYNMATDYATCSCRMWETDGILCRHILRVYSVRHVFAIPPELIVQRWTKGIKGNQARPNTASLKAIGIPNMEFLNSSISLLYDIGGMAIGNAAAEKLIEERIQSLREDVISVSGVTESQSRKRNKVDLSSGIYWNLFGDPIPIKERGWTAPRKQRHPQPPKKGSVQSQSPFKGSQGLGSGRGKTNTTC